MELKGEKKEEDFMIFTVKAAGPMKLVHSIPGFFNL